MSSHISEESPAEESAASQPIVTGTNPPLDPREPHLVFDNLDLDVVVKVLSKTIFSPSFVVFLPITFLSQVHSKHPAFIISCLWTALVCVVSAFDHIDRMYRSGGNWLFAPEKLKWDEQVVLITGGGSGIGALLAETLAMRNVAVVVLTKDAPKFETENENIYTYLCDVSDYKAVQAVSQKIREEVGDPTIIVNNAGVVKGKLLLDLTEADIQDTFGANTLAQFWVLKAFLPALIRKRGGHIITMSSVLGLTGAAQMTDYCASKAALINLHQSLRSELLSRHRVPGIRTTLVLPSFVRTSLFAGVQFPSWTLFGFLCPPLRPHDVVKSVIEALDSRESGTIRMPFYSHAARVLGEGVGAVPCWLRDLIQRIAGADFAMKEYGPHPDAAERMISAQEHETDRSQQKID